MFHWNRCAEQLTNRNVNFFFSRFAATQKQPQVSYQAVSFCLPNIHKRFVLKDAEYVTHLISAFRQYAKLISNFNIHLAKPKLKASQS